SVGGGEVGRAGARTARSAPACPKWRTARVREARAVCDLERRAVRAARRRLRTHLDLLEEGRPRGGGLLGCDDRALAERTRRSRAPRERAPLPARRLSALRDTRRRDRSATEAAQRGDRVVCRLRPACGGRVRPRRLDLVILGQPVAACFGIDAGPRLPPRL